MRVLYSFVARTNERTDVDISINILRPSLNFWHFHHCCADYLVSKPHTTKMFVVHTSTKEKSATTEVTETEKFLSKCGNCGEFISTPPHLVIAKECDSKRVVTARLLIRQKRTKGRQKDKSGSCKPQQNSN